MCPNCGRPYGKRKRCYYCDGRGGKKIGCSVRGCNRPHEAQGYCNLHYLRFRKWGDASVVHPTARGFYIRKDGYRIVYRNGVAVLEHRAVMKEAIGRQLESWEHVHHLNGDKTDNRLDNLMLMTNHEHQKLHDWPHLHARFGQVTLACQGCGSEYQVKASKAAESHYCSRACLLTAMHAARRKKAAGRRKEKWLQQD